MGNLTLSRAYFPHLFHRVSLSNVDEGEKSLQQLSAIFKINFEVAVTLGVLRLCAIAAQLTHEGRSHTGACDNVAEVRPPKKFAQAGPPTLGTGPAGPLNPVAPWADHRHHGRIPAGPRHHGRFLAAPLGPVAPWAGARPNGRVSAAVIGPVAHRAGPRPH